MSLIGTLNTGVSALRTFSKGLEVIGNNIANVNTTGYKSSTASYADSFSNTLGAATPTTAAGTGRATTQVGTGVGLAGIGTNYAQGTLASTGNVTDLAIAGRGFFVVKESVSGARFASRDGSFRLDDNGYLVNQSGLRLQGLTGAGLTAVGDVRVGQTLPAGAALQSIEFDSSGNLTEFYSNGTSAVTNRVQLQNFTNTAALTREGNNLYSGLDLAGPSGGGILAGGNNPNSNGLGKLQSGALEQSNVDLTMAFSDLITTQRSFQAGSRLVTVSDTVLEDVVNLKR